MIMRLGRAGLDRSIDGLIEGINGLIDELIDRINGIILAAERGRTAVAQASIV